MSTRLKDLLTGLAGIGALAGLAALLLLYGELTGVVASRHAVMVAFDQAAGLRVGSVVTLNGVPVGEVGKIELVDPPTDPERPVLVRANIDRSARLPATVTAHVEAGLLGGGARLALRIPLPYEPGTAMLPQDPPPLIVGRAGGLEETIAAVIDERLAGFAESFEELRTLARTYTQVGQQLNDMLGPIDPDAPDSTANLRLTVMRLNETLAEARAAIVLASGWLGDEQLQADVRSAIWRANVFVEHATNAVDAYANLAGSLSQEAGRAVEALDARAGEVVATLQPVADGASLLLERMRSLATLAAEGEGTIGQLLNNPDLYKSLVDSAQRLEATLRKVELLLDKIREEGIGVSF